MLFLSLYGLGNTMVSALYLKPKNNCKIIVKNRFSESIFKYYGHNNVVVIEGRFWLLKLAVILIKNIQKVIIEPGSSGKVYFLTIITLNRTSFVKPNYLRNISDEYEMLGFSRELPKTQYNSRSLPNSIFVYIGIDGFEKKSKQLTIKNLKKIEERFDGLKITYAYFHHEEPYIDEDVAQWIRTKSILIMHKYSSYENLLRDLSQFGGYVGPDSFLFHVFSLGLNYFSLPILGSTGFRFIHEGIYEIWYPRSCNKWPCYKGSFKSISGCSCISQST